MSTDTIAVQVPVPLYQRLARLAALTNRPLESLVAQTLSAGLPPLPDDIPTTMRDALQALEQFDDTALEQVARERMSEAQVEQFEELRERQRAGLITTSEQQTLDALMHDADLRMLRKAYAAVLLKLRGQPVPTLTELDT
ncbi:MAG: hypothetical protein AB4911_12925 [Oscillochloridaceae bacterium umkhey_bin13]